MGLQSPGTCLVSDLPLVQYLITALSVSSAVIQRYLQQILDAALSPNSSIQTSAVEILSYTIKQGLAHPLLVWSTVNDFITSYLFFHFTVFSCDSCSGDLSYQQPQLSRSFPPYDTASQAYFTAELWLHLCLQKKP